MKNRGKILLIFILAADLFLLSFLFSQNKIETIDTFISTQSYGFPLSAFSIAKTTEDYNEARKIYKLDTLELLSQGWEIKTESGFYGFFPVIAVNFLFYLLASTIFVNSFNFFILFLGRKIREGGQTESC